MKLIGRGWQYSVYDMENGRVLKKYHSRFLAYVIMFRDCFPYLHHPVWKFYGYYIGCKKHAIESLKKIGENSLDKNLFGNPKIYSNLGYEQDFIKPLSEYFCVVNKGEGKKMIDRFVVFSTQLLRQSLIEKNFNIAENFGLNKAGEIVLMDLGEIYIIQDEINNRLQNRVWAAPSIVNRLPVSLREYFVEKMDEAFGSKK